MNLTKEAWDVLSTHLVLDKNKKPSQTIKVFGQTLDKSYTLNGYLRGLDHEGVGIEVPTDSPIKDDDGNECKPLRHTMFNFRYDGSGSPIDVINGIEIEDPVKKILYCIAENGKVEQKTIDATLKVA